MDNEANLEQGQKIIEVEIEKEMQKSFLDYSMSVIVSRALPDVRDGLKPVHRRILYTLFENGLGPDKAYRKCADTVGAVLGRYHPHGDASVYDALVRLAQDFSMRYMLVDGHGNFGSVDGDPPAAYRYTESRMSKISVEMLTDIDKDTVNFVSNYDDRLKEPEVLPSRFPNLLANGSTGIAVGMATNIPPHNLGEVIDAICCLIDNPAAELPELMEYIKGPAFYYKNDEVVVVASERPVLQTTFDIECDQICELKPGEAVVVNKKGEFSLEKILDQRGDSACSFERIYFSRGSDRDIYRERKKLGDLLMKPILKAIDNDVEHTVFSFIPNTAEVAYYGMLGSFKRYINEQKIQAIESLGHMPTHEELEKILEQFVRSEKVAWKDIKLRTFITEGNSRNDLASHVYDVTYEVLEKGVDNLVVIDDSIVRGTTLRESIIKILDRLHPKKIVIVSSSPQIRYPDYYGIDMAKLEEFIAFRACIALLQDRGMQSLIDETYKNCIDELKKPKEEMQCCVKALYKPFTVEELNTKMVELLRPAEVTTPIELVYQSIEGLHTAIPDHKGDWYFTGNYPTPGGMKLVNQAFINYYDNVYQYEQKF